MHNHTTLTWKSRTYSSWDHMLQRCNNPNNHKYNRYGGRGIRVCKRWLKFENFLADMGERPAGRTLDRKDNDGNYCKRNCRWATPKEQQRVHSDPTLYAWGGRIGTIIDLAAIFGVSRQCMRNRVKKLRRSVS